MVIYDFGYCYRINVRDRPIIKLLTDLCETADENTDNKDNTVSIYKYSNFLTSSYIIISVHQLLVYQQNKWLVDFVLNKLSDR